MDTDLALLFGLVISELVVCWITLELRVCPQIITKDGYVCEACRDVAMFRVNHELEQEVLSRDNQQAGSSHQGHTNVCLLCSISILCRQSDKILRDNPFELQQCMINILESRLAPHQIIASDPVGYVLKEKHYVVISLMKLDPYLVASNKHWRNLKKMINHLDLTHLNKVLIVEWMC